MKFKIHKYIPSTLNFQYVNPAFPLLVISATDKIKEEY